MDPSSRSVASLSTLVAAVAAVGIALPAVAAKPAVLEHEPLYGAGDADPTASGNPFLVPIPGDAVTDPDSEDYVSRMMGEIDSGGFRLMIGSSGYPVYYTSDDPSDPTPRHTVTLTAQLSHGAWGYCGKKFAVDIPIPTFVEADPSTDGRMVVLDRQNQCAYNFWGYDHPGIVPGDPGQHAYWVAGLPFESIGIHEAGELGAGRAANFMATNGLIWPDELIAGHIPHAISFGYSADAILDRSYVAPATHSDGMVGNLDFDALPEGARIQLNPAIPLENLGLDAHLETIGRALQDYGMFLSDGNGGGVALGAVSGLSANPNPWTEVSSLPRPLPPSLSLMELIEVAEGALVGDQWLFRVLELGTIETNVPPICPDNPCVAYVKPADPCSGCCAVITDASDGVAKYGAERSLAFAAALSLLGVVHWRRRVRSVTR